MLFAFLAVGMLLLSGCTGVRNTSRTFNKVVVDAGHGGHDSGATTRYGREKVFALDVAQRVDAKLRAAGFSTVMTRKGDYFVDLNKRARISNMQMNAIFVSIHFNYSPKRSVSGAEVYYKSSVSKSIARNILNQLDALPGTSSRGVRTANFRVLKRNQFPAVLVECGFLTNPGEGSRCASAGYREMLATAIARGIVIQRYGQ